MHERFRIKAAPGGGISMGWSAYAMYRECPRRFWWHYREGGDGIVARNAEAGEPLIYGALWHAAYCARLKGNDMFEVMAGELAEHGRAPNDPIVDRIVNDLDWYDAQPKDFKLRVIAAEQELAVPVGRHEMRGTIDLVGELEGSWGGRVALIDHKTTAAATNPTAHERYKSSRQITFYLALWGKANPSMATLDGMINVVPSNRRGGVTRLWALREPHQLARILADFETACDEIERLQQRGEAAFPENPSACVVWRPCQYLTLCAADSDTQRDLIEGVYVPRYPLVQAVRAAELDA